jgi:hypothetical protein
MQPLLSSIFLLVLFFAAQPCPAGRGLHWVRLQHPDGNQEAVQLYSSSHALLVAVSQYKNG